MEGARVSAVLEGNRLAEDDALTTKTARTGVIDSEINKISSGKFPKPSGGLSAAVKRVAVDVDDGGGEESKLECEVLAVPLRETISNGNHQSQVANVPETTTANGNATTGVVKMSTNTGSLSSSSSINSLLLRRRRLKRNFSAAATSSAPSSAAAPGGKMHSASSSSSLGTRSLDRKVLLRQKQIMQLQLSDREWVRADLQRGCIHVHDKAMPSYLRPVLCTLETTAGEVALRLSQPVGKGGSVVRVVSKGSLTTDLNGNCNERYGFSDGHQRFGQNDTVKSQRLHSLKRSGCRDEQPAPTDDRLRLLVLPNDNQKQQQQQDVHGFTPDSLLDGRLLSARSPGIQLGQNADSLVDEESDSRHNGTDSCGLNSGSDIDSSTFDDLSSSTQLSGHRDSLSDGMILGTDASILSPRGDSATEGLDPFGSSSDELELDCTSSSLVIDSIAQQRQKHSPDCTSTANNNNAVNSRLCGGELSNGVTAETDSGVGGSQELLNPGKLQCNSSSNSLSRPLKGSAAVKHDTLHASTSKTAPVPDHGHFTPTLYVQMHGEAARRLGHDEKPLKIQNDYLYKLGFKDPWRVQDEGMDTEIGCLIRFFAGKPPGAETSERVQLAGTYNVRKGKMQLPVNRWTRRQVILCGTCLIVSSVKDSQTGKMHILPLIGGKVEEVKKHSHCLAFSSSGPQSQTYYISFDNFTEHLRWQRQAAKMVSQRISSVDLSCCSLEQLPPNLFYSQDLTHLNLKQNFLSPGRGLADLQRFSKLRSLNLSNNHLGEFPLAICDIPTLTEVNLSCNCLTSVHSAVGAMHNLQTFLLDGNCLRSLPAELGELQQLSYLGLSFNEFSEVPAVLHRLTAMERLCMSGNNLSALSLPLLCQLHVKQVDLRLNQIRSVVPEEPEFLCHVTHLDLRDNQLQELDASLFPRLEVLHCERNRLTSLTARGSLLKGLYASSNELCQLEVYPVPGNLTYMDVSRNRLESLPEWVCESKKLEVLDISHNLICELPIRLFCSNSLRKLLLGHNQLRRLPERLERTQMEVLDVQHNQLLELPSNLFLKADSLRCLNASANKLESLPPSSLSEEGHSILQELYLTNNRLTDKCVPQLTGHCHLRVLHLAYNHLQTFPASKMAKLEELEEVDLSGNQLKAIPTTILSCRRMHTLIAHSNCIEVFPEVMQLMEMKCVDLSCNELSEITLPENLPPKLQELDLTGNPRLILDHKTLELLNNIRCFRIDQSPTSFSASEGPGAPAVWSHGYTEASGVKNKLCVAALSASNFCESREALYGVFDGDRNVEVPYLLQCTMSDVLAEELHKTKSEEDYMTNTFLVMQRKLGTAGQKLGGSAALCHIKHDPMDPAGCFTLTAANVGKCQAILCRDGKPLPLSVIHNVGVAEEYQRIRQNKAIVTEDNKVNGVTDSTRIMGYSFLYPSVIPRPHVQTVTLTPQDEFFILGSRGLWDAVSPGEAVEAVRNVPDALAAAKKLCTLAQGYGCNDSLSAVVVQLNVTEDCCCCCELGAPPPPSPSLFPPSISVVIRDRPAAAAAAAPPDALPMPSSCSEISSEVSTSEMSSEVGSTASDDPPQSGLLHEHHAGPPFPPEPRCCALHPICLAGSFQRQLSSALSDNGLDSEDEEPIAGVFSNGSRVEVEVDIHCLRARERAMACQPPPPPPTPEALDEAAELSAGEAEAGWSGGGPPQGRGGGGSGGGGGDCSGRTLGKRRGNGSVAPQEKSHNLIEVATDAPTKKQGGYFAAPAQPDPDDQFIIPPELEEEVKELMKQHQQQQQRAPPSEQPADYYDTPL
ncbi:PH domain leucine-rich repeat-containing protein phosphatase 1-like [Megalops cyprinoides]|uniref:PH domain leucine-rich repeat-containing protein phosphatase 1-like n=1 Tax=Megalops cyprinoides TaxID=118141 RepID=UPI00186520D9|nr:PH domain leucine-rich repeat-containing protein phosphatase 1-like [Megalops cyprinoides]